MLLMIDGANSCNTGHPESRNWKDQGGLRILVPCAKILHNIIECAVESIAVVTWP